MLSCNRDFGKMVAQNNKLMVNSCPQSCSALIYYERASVENTRQPWSPLP